MTDASICIMKMMARMHIKLPLVFCREDDISDIHKVAIYSSSNAVMQ